MSGPSSKLGGGEDMTKFEKTRELKEHIDKICEDYITDLRSKEMRIRQRAVALYFIDKQALMAGRERGQAQTVDCCSLREEHITLDRVHESKEYVVEFDFLGYIHFYAYVAVGKRVCKNVQLFMDNKKGSDVLLDRLNTSILNEYLNGLMPGLTARVLHTYNASITLQQQLDELTDETDNLRAKMLSYNRANRAVAELHNHQSAVRKTHNVSKAYLREKISKKRRAIAVAKDRLNDAIKTYESALDNGNFVIIRKSKKEKREEALERLNKQLRMLERQESKKERDMEIILAKSKLDYLDPRISVAWRKRLDVPIEKVYNKTQREKFG